MSLRRRLTLLEWAAKNDAAIIEDNYDSEFRFEERPIEPLHTLGTSGRVIHLGSFSKTLLPGLRLGFVVTPPSCTPTLHKARLVADWHGSTLVQSGLARFMDNGGFGRHIGKLNRVYAERRGQLISILNRELSTYLKVIPSIAGIHVTAVSRGASVKQIKFVAERAGQQGVSVQELSRLSIDTPMRGGLLFGYGAIASDKIQEGLRRLRGCFDDVISA